MRGKGRAEARDCPVLSIGHAGAGRPPGVQGAHALYIEGLSIRTEKVAASRGHRPWVPDPTAAKATPRAQPEPFADDGGADEATRASTAIQKSDGRTA